MNNPFEYVPSKRCREAFGRLLENLDALRDSHRPEDIDLIRELDAGKMLGVLVAVDQTGAEHVLHAFSGQLGESGFHHSLFVGPVLDYLAPDGHFKRKEGEITALNRAIERFEADNLAPAMARYELLKGETDRETETFRQACRQSKAAREARRSAGDVSEEEREAMIRQSQFEKAELRRIKQRASARLAPAAALLAEARSRLEAMKERRRRESESLQAWLFDSFRLLNGRGEYKSVGEIFADTPMGVPPSGAGECCAPKLLQAAFLRGWRPVEMAEFWHGRPKGGDLRVHGQHYPACRGKCLPVLTWMLEGVDVTPPLAAEGRETRDYTPAVVYENEWFCVVDKPSGMLSVPGKGRAVSVEQWLQERYGAERRVKVAHRLDRDTSGLLVATFGDVPYRVMQHLFASRQVRKSYVALLEGDYREKGVAPEGRICLPLSPDWLDRPRQRVDLERGKEGVTEYAFTAVADGRSRVTFRPLTGRTHQLRVHAASPLGLGMPIVGDPLYGRAIPEAESPAPRLHLHAHTLAFAFPLTGQAYAFTSPLPF